MSQPITAAAVNELRKRTDMPMMECKSALTEAGGDAEKAIDILRSRNKNVTAKRSMNETAEGRIAIYIDKVARTAGIIDMRCESAPTAKSAQFVDLANDLAAQVADQDPENVEDMMSQHFVGGAGKVKDRIEEVIGLIRENMKINRFKRLSGGVFGQYIHHDGSLGVLIQFKGPDGASDEMLRDICAHVAAMNPQYIRIEEAPADIVAKEKDIAKQQVEADPKNAGKPANIIEKIIEGKLRTWYGETVLQEQLVANQAKYEKKTVGQVLKTAGLEVVKVIRLKVGELTL
jgi:elongation factor Ts